MHYVKTAYKLRAKILKFFGELSLGLPKVARRFITEALYGIQARQSVRLTEIVRSLEEKISLKKTVYRLSRQLGRRGIWRWVMDSLCRMGSWRIQRGYSVGDGYL